MVVLKLDIDFITLWDDSMEYGSVTIRNIFELFKQTALIDADKNYADNDDWGEWERRIVCNITLMGQVLLGTKFCSLSVKSNFSSKYVGFVLWIIKRQASKKTKFHQNKPFFFRLWFLLNPFQAVVFLCPPENILMFSRGIEREHLTEIG